jgi:flagellar hook-associated protein 1 FlgK
MPGSLLGIGVSGLQAAQLGLATTSHNIANANTPGYNRQLTIQGTLIPQLTGSGFVGQGTAVQTIRRQVNDFLDRQVVLGESRSAALTAFISQSSQIDDLLADESAGLSPALQEFFNGVQNLANDPSNAVTRQGLLSAADGLVSRFRLLDQRMGELASGVNQQVTSAVAEINSIAQSLAQLNQNIDIAESSIGQPANDLRDQRDRLVLDLNRLLGATVTPQGTAYNVFIGNGIPLVIGTQVTAIAAVASATDPGRAEVGVVTPGGTLEIRESSLTGGLIGGLMDFRNQALDAARNALGRIAAVLADSFNAQHQLGQDLNGALGGLFFTVPAPSVNSSANNTGNAQLGAAYAATGALTTSDYGILFDGANYVVTRQSDGNQQTFAALPAVLDGITLSLAAGAPNAGDEFLLRPTAAGASQIAVAIADPALIAAAAPIRTDRAGANTGNARISAGSVDAPPPPNANLTQTVTLTFTGAAAFDVAGTGTGNPTGVAYTSGGNISFNGWTVQISGTPAAGDVFTVQANLGGVTDNRNALLLGALRTQNTIANGTATYQSAYAQMVSLVGDEARQAQVGGAAQTAALGQARAARESFSGVNLDEEAANLLRYQQAYQASARVIQVGSRLFEDLLNAMG